MRTRFFFIFILFLLLACGQGSEKVPPPEKGLLLNPKTDTLPEREILGSDDDDDLGADEILEEEEN